MAYTVDIVSFAKIRFPKISLRLFNNFLSIIIAVLALYIIGLPFLPQIGWWVKHDSPVKSIVSSRQDTASPSVRQAIAEDKLFIPHLELEELIYGGGKASLSKGVWRVAHTSTPDKGGNTVLVGHRFTYKQPNGVFYHLDKVQKDDPITLHWQGKAYEYTVVETKVVPATEVSVENNTEETQLTIYTCTPLWSVANRLVIIAKPLEVTP
jgi:LPXTG-site transpeptidase (sortase) family protein